MCVAEELAILTQVLLVHVNSKEFTKLLLENEEQEANDLKI